MIGTRSLTYSAGAWSAALPVELDGEQTLVLAFGSSSFFERPAPFAELAAALPNATLLGCSTAGEIVGAKIGDDTVVASVVRFERTRLRRVAFELSEFSNGADAGEALARGLDAPDLAGVVVLCEGLGVNGSELTRGLRAVLGARVPVTGGLAGDGGRFERTWVLDGATPRIGWVSALGLYGAAVRIKHGSKGGWDIFGPERVATRSQGNVLYELDGKPALDLYRRYLGERAAGLPATALLFPLAVRATRDDAPVVRTVLSVDEIERSMTFAGDIPQGSLAQLMRANFERLIQGASEAATESSAADEGPSVCIAISCIGRRLVLRERAEEELEAVQDALPGVTEQIGFYSYGEISPHVDGGCELHNQTMTLTILSEA